jgi:hypothetical protein
MPGFSAPVTTRRTAPCAVAAILGCTSVSATTALASSPRPVAAQAQERQAHVSQAHVSRAHEPRHEPRRVRGAPARWPAIVAALGVSAARVGIDAGSAML